MKKNLVWSSVGWLVGFLLLLLVCRCGKHSVETVHRGGREGREILGLGVGKSGYEEGGILGWVGDASAVLCLPSEAVCYFDIGAFILTMSWHRIIPHIKQTLYVHDDNDDDDIDDDDDDDAGGGECLAKTVPAWSLASIPRWSIRCRCSVQLWGT